MFMKVKSKKNTSLFLLLVFILPFLIKFEHHHEIIDCKIKNEKHFHSFHKKCSVCSFEFSVFSSDFLEIDLQKEKPLELYFCTYSSHFYSNISQFSFLLRAPPYKQI